MRSSGRTHTNEPIIITARLIQIGKGQVKRNIPQQQVQVEEVPNSVIRMVVFRDEYEAEGTKSWDQFIQRPVKTLLQMFPELGDDEHQHRVLDCWDRQYLSHLMQRSKPSDAQLFIVSFRLQTKEAEALAKRSGRLGVYLEPRESDGRKPASTHRVIWLGRATKDEALDAMRATDAWSCLARTNRRYGIRVRCADALEVHNQHKPAIPYLDTASVTEYLGGPFPYGATRSTIAKLFESWAWAARPIQPSGRAANGQGIMWLIQAAAAPQFKVYTLAHSDVLLTELPKKNKKQMPAGPDIQGSEKTIEAIRTQSAAKATPPDSHDDPLMKDDPWKNAKYPKTTVDSPSAHTTNLDARCAQMEKRIMQQIQSQMTTSKDDHMAQDETADALTQRVVLLEQVVQQQQQSQAQQTQELTGQVQQLHQRMDQHTSSSQEIAQQVQQLNHRVETQTASLQKHLDATLGDHLAHIERLLSKKPRTD